MLLLLLAGQRGQTIHVLDVRNMDLSYSHACFRVGKLLKHTRPGTHIKELAFKAYAPDRRLCVITVLKEYLKWTLMIQATTKQLLFTYGKPIHAASRDSIRCWTKEVLSRAGINISIFTPQSTRSVSTSKPATKLKLSTILTTAGWSRDSMFRKFYQKTIDKKFDF